MPDDPFNLSKTHLRLREMTCFHTSGLIKRAERSTALGEGGRCRPGIGTAGIEADATMDPLWYVQSIYRLFKKITGGIFNTAGPDRHKSATWWTMTEMCIQSGSPEEVIVTFTKRSQHARQQN
jgi:hypothetical protein